MVYGEIFSIERFIVTKWKKMSQDVAEKPDRVIPKEYGVFLKEIKDKILSSQVKAALSDRKFIWSRKALAGELKR